MELDGVTVRVNYLKAGCAILVGLYGIVCARQEGSCLIDGTNLVIHEAGHLLLGWFGELPGVAGGTIAQLFVPAGFTAYFALSRSFYSSAVTLFWTGQSFWNVSTYVKDALRMELPLVSVGGGDAIHDWNYMLGRAGMLTSAQAIGDLVSGLGSFIVLAAVVLVFVSSVERLPQNRDQQ